MPKNIHTYRAKLDALWNQMSHTVDYLIKCKGIDWVEDNGCGNIRVSNDRSDWYFSGTGDECAEAVDDLVLKMQREAHNDPNYTV